MGWKIKAASVLTVMSSWLNASATSSEKNENTDSLPQTEQTHKPTKDNDPKNGSFTVQEISNTTNLDQDSIRLTVEKNKDAFQDSIIMVQKQENLKNAQELMLYVIAHFEGMKCKAYFDNAAKIWTINIGNTVRPDGKKVRCGDLIHNEQEALDYVSAHVDKHMANDMIKYLPLDKMTQEEIAVMGSLFYNCGSGILRNKDKTPSEFAKMASEYFTTHGDSISEEFDKAFLNRCKVKGKINKVVQERRKNELTFLHGDIKITLDDNINSGENVINLKKAVLGTLYGCNGNPETILSRFSEESRYYCPSDSLNVAINKELSAPKQIRRAPATKKNGTPQKRPVQQRRSPQRTSGR